MWFRKRRVAEKPAPPTKPEAEPAVEVAASEAFGPSRHAPLTAFLDEAVDQPKMAAAAGTSLERAYYAHAGRPMFKWVHYLPLYDQALGRFVGKAPRVLEIGLAQGGSLQLWRDWLGAGASVVGLDLDPTCKRFEAEGFPIYIGDQGDPELLARIAAAHGPFDIVIDDGSHIPRHQIASFKALWPHVKAGGVYVCEDLHTNYWAGWEGGLGRDDTFIAFIKTMIDRLHDKYHLGSEIEDTTPEEIAFITLADSIAFFHKQAPATPYMALVGAKPDA